MSLDKPCNKFPRTIIPGNFINKTIRKVLLVYSFQKIFLIGQNLKCVYVIYSFDKLLIFFD